MNTTDHVPAPLDKYQQSVGGGELCGDEVGGGLVILVGCCLTDKRQLNRDLKVLSESCGYLANRNVMCKGPVV